MNRTAHLVVDLGYGDAGKGSIVDVLAHRFPVHTVIRYNGGPQAGHTVVTTDGRQHTFAQFGSASFLPHVKTHLSRFMFIHPLAMISEAEHLQTLGVRDLFHRLTIDEECLVITPFQQAANRLREMARSDGRHGSCGMGVGETAWDREIHDDQVLFARDLKNTSVLRRKLAFIRDWKIEHLGELLYKAGTHPLAEQERQILFDQQTLDRCVEWFQAFSHQVKIIGADVTKKILDAEGDVVFEGAQGVLLDEWYGFFPYVTRSTTTMKYAHELLQEKNYQGAVNSIGVVRAYATRHGPGPFVTEDQGLTQALQDSVNVFNPWQRNFRVGWFDAVATRYAIEATGGVDELAVTCLDRLKPFERWFLTKKYEWDQELQFSEAHDLDRQTRLTELLMKVRPTLTETTEQARNHDERITQHVRAIETELEVPVKTLSIGTTCDDKIFSISPVQKAA